MHQKYSTEFRSRKSHLKMVTFVIYCVRLTVVQCVPQSLFVVVELMFTLISIHNPLNPVETHANLFLCPLFLNDVGIWSPSTTPQPIRRQFSDTNSEPIRIASPTPPPAPPLPVWKPSRSAGPSPVLSRRPQGTVRFESPSPQLGRKQPVSARSIITQLSRSIYSPTFILFHSCLVGFQGNTVPWASSQNSVNSISLLQQARGKSINIFFKIMEAVSKQWVPFRFNLPCSTFNNKTLQEPLVFFSQFPLFKTKYRKQSNSIFYRGSITATRSQITHHASRNIKIK